MLCEIFLSLPAILLDAVAEATVLDVLHFYVDDVGLLTFRLGALLFNFVICQVDHNGSLSSGPPFH